MNGRDKKIGAFVGANQKLSKDTPKRCAEMKALGEAKKADYRFPLAIFVAGTTDRELIKDVTGHATATLSPCEPCSHLMHESTVIVAVGHDEDVFEAYTGKELWGLYGNDETAHMPQHPIGDPGFAQFTGARALYEASVVPVMGIPEGQSRMMRAEAVVHSLRSLAVT
jgi:hypothetical protein